MRISQRASRIAPFYVMEMAKAASVLAQQARHTDKPMVFLNIGEPDFTAPPLVQQAAVKAINEGKTQYTHALGLDPLRERISGWYATRFGVTVPARRIVVTAGASAALQLACLTLIEAGDEVLMPDPCYPCNRQFVQAADGRAVLLPTGAAQRFQLSAAQVQTHWQARTRGVLLASPSNPTGTSIAFEELKRIHQIVSDKGGITMVDEIYLGLSYDASFGQTALAIDDNIISINSFSKYFNMTGWRLGWLVAPERYVDAIDRIAQNVFLAASTPSQYAALAAFEPVTLALLDARREEFRARRDFLLPALRALGFGVPQKPRGAFYIYANCAALAPDSFVFARDLLEQAGVAITPGIDFGDHAAREHVRFAYTRPVDVLREGVARIARFLGKQD